MDMLVSRGRTCWSNAHRIELHISMAVVLRMVFGQLVAKRGIRFRVSIVIRLRRFRRLWLGSVSPLDREPDSVSRWAIRDPAVAPMVPQRTSLGRQKVRRVRPSSSGLLTGLLGSLLKRTLTEIPGLSLKTMKILIYLLR